MPKRFIALTLSSGLLFLSVATALADDTTTQTRPAKGKADQSRGAGVGQQASNEKKMEAMEKSKGKRADFQEKLSGMSDERKKSLIQRIDAKLTELNNRRTTHMLNALTRLEAILAKIQEEAEVVKAGGATTTTLDAAITEAQAALTTAKEAVMAQQAKDYAIELTTEAQARATVGKSVSGLQADLRTTRQAVIAAKQAVKNAAMELAKLRPVPTAQTTPTVTETLTPTASEVVE